MKIKKEIIFLKGKNIYLRPFMKKDLTKKYLNWINSKQKNFFLETGKIPVSEIELEKYYLDNLKSKNSILFAVCNNKHKHIGNSSLSQIDWLNRRCTYGRLIGENIKTKGVGTETLKL